MKILDTAKSASMQTLEQFGLQGLSVVIAELAAEVPTNEKEKISAKVEAALATVNKVRDAFKNGTELALSSDETSLFKNVYDLVENTKFETCSSPQDFLNIAVKAIQELIGFDEQTNQLINEKISKYLEDVPSDALTKRLLSYEMRREIHFVTGASLDELQIKLNQIINQTDIQSEIASDVLFLNGEYVQQIDTTIYQQIPELTPAN